MSYFDRTSPPLLGRPQEQLQRPQLWLPAVPSSVQHPCIAHHIASPSTERPPRCNPQLCPPSASLRCFLCGHCCCCLPLRTRGAPEPASVGAVLLLACCCRCWGIVHRAPQPVKGHETVTEKYPTRYLIRQVTRYVTLIKYLSV